MIQLAGRVRSLLILGSTSLTLAACSEGMDLDLRGFFGNGWSTSNAARNATEERPAPDQRGVISYPNYQVAIARRGDTLTDVANRVALPVQEVAEFNGIDAAAPLRQGEVVALPRRVADAPGSGLSSPSGVDVTTLAGSAIDNAAPTTPVAGQSTQVAGLSTEPVRHRVERGETAYSISRLYDVPVRSLSDWNGLGSDFAVREGQYLLIPVSRTAPPPTADTSNVTTTSLPGAVSETPTPPSAAEPLPDEDTQVAIASPSPDEPVADVGATTKPTTAGAMAYPVQGTVIRDYAKGRNEGIDIQAAPGSPVKAAAGGQVAALTESSEGVPIIVVRHPDKLLTVYANVDDVQVKKGDTVRRGQTIARLRSGDDAYVHFEIRDGFDSVDPNPYLN